MASYVTSAPSRLIEWHKNKKINVGFKELERLLTDPHMELAWSALKKQNRLGNWDAEGEKLFSEIKWILRQSRKVVVPTRVEEKKHFLKLADMARKLLSEIEGQTLDRMAFEYFPAIDMELNGVHDWSSVPMDVRDQQARTLLNSWPSFTEMLEEFEGRARALADEAMRKERVIERDTASGKGSSRYTYKERYFVRALMKYFETRYGAPLYGTTTRVTNAVLETQFSRDEVEKMQASTHKEKKK